MAVDTNPGGSGMPIGHSTVTTAEGVYNATAGYPSNNKEAGSHTEDLEKHANSSNDGANDRAGDSGSELKQDGVVAVEAVTQLWSKKVLWITFVLLYVLTVVESLLVSVEGTLSPYVTSAFGSHGLLGTVSIVSTILGGVCNLTIAKIINIWGRTWGMIGTTLLIVLGMIMKAACQNVETYAAAQVLYWVGRIGLLYIISIALADMTSLKNRMIMFGFNSTPTIIVYWAGPNIASRFYYESSFRWAFGAFAIILIGMAAPNVGVFKYYEHKAKKAGMLRPKSNRTVWESTKYYFIQFDVVGLFLVTVGWSLLLLPFSLNSILPGEWANGGIIAMFVLGPISLAAFVVWERYFTPVPFFPWEYLTDRTILGSCLAHGLMYASIFAWDIYYGSFLQVANYQAIDNANYIVNSFSLVSSFIMPFVGLAIRYWGNYKWVGMASIPFIILGVALLVEFRKPETHIGLLVMCQAFNGIGSGILVLASQIAIMTVVGHNEVAVGLALHSMFGGIGAAIGMAISAGIWVNTLPYKIYEFLPDDAKDQAATIYGDLSVQTELTGEMRDAVIRAYADVQHKMVIAGCAFTPFVLISILVWKNLNVKQVEKERGPQTKGNVW